MTLRAKPAGSGVRVQVTVCVALLIAAMTAPATGQTSAPVKYNPVQVAPREHAPYILGDGTIQIITYSRLAGLIHALNDLFVSTHPGIRFTVKAGDNYSAMAALTFDRTAFAPLGCEYTRIGLGNNLKIAAEPLTFRIAHATLSPGDGVPALGIIVNPANPITSLTTTQLTRMFAIGGPIGDIATWGQAGVTGPLANRELHPIGPLTTDYIDSDDPQAGEYLSTSKMDGLNMNHRYVGLPAYSEVVERVSEDASAIGITALNIPLQGVNRVKLKSGPGSASEGSAADIAAGRYPLDRFVFIDLRVGKGSPVDVFAKEYMRMVLSDEGQRVIAGESTGYIPLSPGELAQERARLDP